MGRADVRIAVQNYLQNLAVPFLGTVFPARNYVDENDYTARIVNNPSLLLPAGQNYGCVVFINLTNDDRQRKADTGRGFVEDWCIHKVALELWFASNSGDPLGTQMAYDTTVDTIFTGVRADPLLGAPQTVWSAAEFNTGISHMQSEPYTDEDGMTVFINGLIRMDVYEWLAGSGV